MGRRRAGIDHACAIHHRGSMLGKQLTCHSIKLGCTPSADPVTVLSLLPTCKTARARSSSAKAFIREYSKPHACGAAERGGEQCSELPGAEKMPRYDRGTMQVNFDGLRLTTELA